MEQIMCIFGDSITWGAWDISSGGWASRLRKYFESNNHDVELYNCGISGDTVGGVLKRIDVESDARKPEIIILAIGINDSLYINKETNSRTPADTFQNDINLLIKKAKNKSQTVIFVGLTNVDESRTAPCSWKPTKFYTNKRIKDYNTIIIRECKNAKIPYLEMFDLLKKGDLEDDLHPNSKGHIKMYIKIRDFLLNNKIVK